MSQALITQEEVSSTLKGVLEEMLKPIVVLEILKRKECLCELEVEKLYGIPAATLRHKRCRGGGPNYRQGAVKGSVFYTHDDIQVYLGSIKKRV